MARELTASGGAFVKGAIDFQALRTLYERAFALARTAEDKIQALERLGETRLNDYHDQDYAAISAVYHDMAAAAEQDLPASGASLINRAAARGRAVLGHGRVYLKQGDPAAAREQFDLIPQACFGAIGQRLQPGEVSKITAVLLQDVAYYTAWSYIQEKRYDEACEKLRELLNMEGVSNLRGKGWHARQLLETLRQLPRLRHDRPRMFFNSDTWPEVRARALTTASAHFEQMQKRVAEYSLSDKNIFDTWQGSPWDNLPESWGKRAMDAAFVYRVTGDPEILEKARQMLRATMDYFLSRKATRCRSYSRIAFAAALDWVWNYLPPDERKALHSDLLEYVYTLNSEDKITGHDTVWTHYYERNIFRCTGMMLLDYDLNDRDYARILEIIARDAWLNVYSFDVKKCLEKGFSDFLTGTLVEYTLVEAQNELWPVLHAWSSALGPDRIPPGTEQIVSPHYVLRNVLGFDTGFLHFGYARAWRRVGGADASLLYDHLGQWLHFFGDDYPEQAGIAKLLRERMDAQGLTGRAQFPVYPFLLDIKNTSPAAIPEGMPIARHFETAGHIVMSSGFKTNDTYALFVCGGTLGEAHLDATHFTIYKQGYLAVDSGTRALLYSGLPGANYDAQTIAHNCVLIYMDGEKFNNPVSAHITLSRDVPILNSGGQRRFPRDAVLLAFESDDYFAYAATDATPVYHEDKCAQMTRQFVFLPPDYFVVFDRVASKKSDYPKTWLLHTANEPEFYQRRGELRPAFYADQGLGRIFCRTLLPTDAVMEKIGGPGKEFWAAGSNWPIATNEVASWHLKGILDDEGNVYENIGRWRVEVKPGAAREQDCFLHFIQTADLSVEAPVNSIMNENQNQVDVAFRVGDLDYAVSFNKTGATGGHIRIRRNGETQIDRAFTNAIMRQEGLALRQP